MEKLLPHIKIQVNDKIYLKDPESSELGLRILQEGLVMIHELGLELFTFKKLAKKLSTTESSIYRYFENKHKMLIYFINYFWAYIDYQIVFSTSHIADPREKLREALEIICDPTYNNLQNAPISITVLNDLLIAESSKAYLTKEVDEENKAGFFIAFKAVCKRIVQILQEIAGDHQFLKTLVSTCVEGIMHQQFFARHLPSLSDFDKNDSSKHRAEVFYQIITNNLRPA